MGKLGKTKDALARSEQEKKASMPPMPSDDNGVATDAAREKPGEIALRPCMLESGGSPRPTIKVDSSAVSY